MRKKKSLKKRQTLIRDILIPKPYLTKKAMELIERLGIQTAEEIVEKYNVDDLRMRVRNVGRATVEYLNACLQKVGLRLPEKRVRRSLTTLRKLESSQAEDVILKALENLSSRHRDVYFSVSQIASDSNLLIDRENLGILVYSVFRYDNTKELLNSKRLSKLVDSVEIFNYNKGYQTFYRLKSKQ